VLIFFVLRSGDGYKSNRDLVTTLFKKKENRELLARASYGKEITTIVENKTFQNLVTEVRRLADRPGETRRNRS
jgi:hypothetical protein